MKGHLSKEDIDGQRTYEKMLNHQENGNQNQSSKSNKWWYISTSKRTYFSLHHQYQEHSLFLVAQIELCSILCNRPISGDVRTAGHQACNSLTILQKSTQIRIYRSKNLELAEEMPLLSL